MKQRMVVVAGIAMSVWASSAARADEPPPPPPRVQTVDHVDGEVNPGTAAAISALGTLGSYAMLFGGVGSHSVPVGVIGATGAMLAPSFGHWYAHHGITTGLVARVAGAGAMVGGLAMVGHCFSFSDDKKDCGGGAAGAVIALLGGGAFLYGTFHDIATADDAADNYNASLRASRPQTVIMPVAMRDGGMGLGIAGSF